MKQHESMIVTYRTQGGQVIRDTVPVNQGSCTRDRADLCLTEYTDGQTQTVSLRLRLHSEDVWERPALERVNPVSVHVPMEKPRSMTALYLFCEWWTRPAFVSSFRDVPALTQVLLMQYEGYCACLVPMVGQQWKATAHGGTEDSLCLELTAGMGGIARLDEPLYLLSEGETVTEAVHLAFTRIAMEKGIPTRTKRRIPEMFHYLGWCSWNAFYTKVDEAGIRQKAAELTEKSVPVRWMIVDDGWMCTNGRFLTDFIPDKQKFPRGFRGMTEEIRSRTSVRWFGVWHALGGYWDGVEPDSPLAAGEAAHLRQTTGGTLVPDWERGAGFYRDWYEALRREGIDFVKVDGQSIAARYYENTVPVSAAVSGLHRALESGAVPMDNAILNCMGMAMENMLSRPASAISRNSDDFFPMQEGSFREHLLENAYNAIYHDQLYCCDWDMFWTNHPDAVKHSLLRAISGGPVYFSDRVGETNPNLLKSLTDRNGRVWMMNRSARPTEDCVFSDPMKAGVLKLHNAAKWGENHTAGGIAVYNLTAEQQTFSFSPLDIPELDEAERYWVYDWFGQTVSSLGREERCCGSIETEGCRWFVVLPETGNASVLGLTEKYVCFAAVESFREEGNCLTAVLQECGPIGWLSRQACSRVELNGTDVTAQVERRGSLWLLPDAAQAGRTILQVRW